MFLHYSSVCVVKKFQTKYKVAKKWAFGQCESERSYISPR